VRPSIWNRLISPRIGPRARCRAGASLARATAAEVTAVTGAPSRP